LLGIAQDKTYATYVRGPASAVPQKSEKQSHKAASIPAAEPWQESMFYLHFLSMPMFVFARNDLMAQVSALNASPTFQLVMPESLHTTVATLVPGFVQTENLAKSPLTTFSLPIPAPYVPLILNTLTQLVCVSGVHRLTSRVSSLTVTLILVVRKAVSLIISVLLFGDGLNDDNKMMMWAGAASVFFGTMLYSAASAGSKGTDTKPAPKDKQE
jgi:solute carrier family 35 (UDP-xylose/UDP-N-acetylglucosamine transporter), member B4